MTRAIPTALSALLLATAASSAEDAGVDAGPDSGAGCAFGEADCAAEPWVWCDADGHWVETGCLGGDAGPLEYSPCNCAPEDPCGWAGDTICDDDCLEVVNEMFDDGADCALVDAGSDSDSDSDADSDTETDSETDTDTAAGGGDDGCGCSAAGARTGGSLLGALLSRGPDGGADAGADGGAGACGGDCAAGVYGACSCAPEDPCAWAGDGVCDAACLAEGWVEEMFDDSADCSPSFDAGPDTDSASDSESASDTSTVADAAADGSPDGADGAGCSCAVKGALARASLLASIPRLF